MIKKLLILIAALFLPPNFVEAEQTVTAVQSFNVRPYEQALKGFESVSRAKIHSIILSENRGVDIVSRIRQVRPDMVLAVGIGALSSVSKLQHLPIVYLMIPNPRPNTSSSQNITGVSMNVAPDTQLNIFQKALPDVNAIGVLYDPVKTGLFLDQAMRISTGKNIRLIAEKIDHPRNVSAAINRMKGRIDAVWMLPDVTVITPETIEIMLLFSFENHIPVLTFSEKYVELGALMSIGIDAFDMGRQAGEMANQILKGSDVSTIQNAYARKAVISINLKIAEKLSIRLNKDVIRDANTIQ